MSISQRVFIYTTEEGGKYQVAMAKDEYTANQWFEQGVSGFVKFDNDEPPTPIAYCIIAEPKKSFDVILNRDHGIDGNNRPPMGRMLCRHCSKYHQTLSDVDACPTGQWFHDNKEHLDVSA